MDKWQKAYIAGFFDGDGCLSACIRRSGKIPRVSLVFTQKDPEILEWIQSYLGGRIHFKRLRLGKAEEIKQALDYFGKYTQVKRKQVELGQELLDLILSKETLQAKVKPQNREARENLALQISFLNQNHQPVLLERGTK